ncbi:MAG: head GIN domain-containing protein [Gammaproteobacteria bacterium]
MKSKLSLIAITVVFLGCTGFCYKNSPTPSPTGTKNYEVTSFNSLDIKSAMQVEIVSGTKPHVEVQGDKDFISHLNVSTKGSTLYLNLSRDWSWHMQDCDNTKIIVTTNSPLQNITLAGSNHLDADNLKTKNLTIDASGSSHCNLSGNVDHLSINVSGSSHIDAAKLVAQDINIQATGSSHIDLSGKTTTLKINAAGSHHIEAKRLIAEGVSVIAAGSSHISVYANRSLDVQAFGDSRIIYLGHPKNVTKNTAGFSRLEEESH